MCPYIESESYLQLLNNNWCDFHSWQGVEYQVTDVLVTEVTDQVTKVTGWVTKVTDHVTKVTDHVTKVTDHITKVTDQVTK